MSSKSKNKEKSIKEKEKENPNSEITINYHEIKDPSDTLNPCLAVFPLNYPSIEIINTPSITQWKLGQNRDRKLSTDKSILGINSRIIYESRNKPMQNRNQYVLGVLNKKTKRELDLYDIESIFNMNQKIRKIEQNKFIKENLNNLNDQEDNLGINKNDMMAQLGTAKAKRQAISSQENIVHEDNISSIDIIKKVLKKKVEEDDMNKNKEEQIKNQLALFKEILPNFDLETKDVSQIFEFNSVIENEKVKNIDHKEVLKMLKKNGEGLEQNKSLFCEFVYEFLKSLVPKINEGKNLSNKIKYSIYLNNLIKFYHLPKMIKENIEKLKQRFSLDEEYIKIMLEKYTKIGYSAGNKITYIKSQNLILKNIYHILCLALLLNWFEFDYTSLANSLRLNNKKIMTYFREIGCSFKNNTDKTKGKNTIVKLNATLKLNLKKKSKPKIK
jgi:DNA-directed RNA polymerase I subunit RPA49